MIRLCPLGLLAIALGTGCFPHDEDPPDVTGPYTGEVRRFVVDRITLATNSTEARAIADDLDGDGVGDNQLGASLGALAGSDNLNLHGDDMIAAGSIASVVEIVADDFADDDTVSVTYLGAPGEPAIEAGGRFADGRFASNRTKHTRVPGRATLHLPVFRDADPSVITLHGMEIDLVPDGAGGYDATLRGATLHAATLAEAAHGLAQMVAADPQAHPDATRFFDANEDGISTEEEIASTALVQSLLAPDFQVSVDGTFTDSLSFAFRVHLSPCASGRCATTPPDDPCFDRVQDGDETAVDCGGSCLACAGGAACADAGDCQSRLCTGGSCDAPSCSDGVRDGMETDVDCGWNCGGCARGEHCRSHEDCASAVCEVTNTCR
ncbi:MAG TPA: hypothetical protein VFQ53_24925 [Kofleriaceae bacterium]|nr:hypothetical protein [Kofleriaceae bacterium]